MPGASGRRRFFVTAAALLGAIGDIIASGKAARLAKKTR
jgi:hypothetical protein